MKFENLISRNYMIGILGAGILAVTSCTPRSQPVASGGAMTAEHLSQGKTIFTNSCGKCHDLPSPDDHSAQDWVGIMNSMAPKAKLDGAQHQMVYDYIVSAKK